MATTVTALRNTPGIQTEVIFTGQHEELMSDASAVMSVTPDHRIEPLPKERRLTDLVGHVVARLGNVLSSIRPDCVVVQGDTASALAGALCAELMGCPLAHVEAGVRSNMRDDPFPEETIRRMISSISELHICYSELARRTLLSEGIAAQSIVVAPHPLQERVERLALSVSNVVEPTVLVTLHRRERREERLNKLLQLVEETKHQSFHDWRFVWHPALDPHHSDLRSRLQGAGVTIAPASPPDRFLEAIATAALVITDSAGTSEEAQILERPLLVFRAHPEGRMDNAPLGPTLATESIDVAAEFVRSILQAPVAPSIVPRRRQVVRSGTVVASHIRDLAISRS